MRAHILLSLLVPAGVLIATGCTRQADTDPFRLVSATPPNAVEMNQLMQADAAFWNGHPSCLPGYTWPVRVKLTRAEGRYETDRTPLPGLTLLKALEVTGLVKGSLVQEKGEAYGIPVTLYAMSYVLTPAAKPWVKTVPIPQDPTGLRDALQMLCFGEQRPVNPHSPYVQIDAKGQTATAWTIAGSPDVRSYVKYRLEPTQSFSDIERNLKVAAHIPEALSQPDAKTLEAAYRTIAKKAGVEPQDVVLMVRRESPGRPWKIYNPAMAEADLKSWPSQER